MALDLEGKLGDVFARKGAIELFFELFLQCNDTYERVFGAGIADFAADFVVKLGYNSHVSYCSL